MIHTHLNTAHQFLVHVLTKSQTFTIHPLTKFWTLRVVYESPIKNECVERIVDKIDLTIRLLYLSLPETNQTSFSQVCMSSTSTPTTFEISNATQRQRCHSTFNNDPMSENDCSSYSSSDSYSTKEFLTNNAESSQHVTVHSITGDVIAGKFDPSNT